MDKLNPLSRVTPQPGSLHSIIILLLTICLLSISCSKDNLDEIEPLSELSEIIDSTLNASIQENDPGIVIAVVYNGMPTLKKGYGMANIENDIPADPDTPYYICSISKSFTAVATLICQEQGLLNVNDKINEYFPEFPEEWSQITIHQLLVHRSGIPDWINDLLYYPDGIINEEAIQHVLDNSALNFEPGTEWKYCNTGYTILAELIQKVSGKAFETFVKENIFDPLNMTSTLFYSEDSPEILDRAIGYAADGSISDYTLRTVGSTGVITSVNDMLLWDKALYSEQIISQELLDLAWTEHTEAAIADYYGYGFSLGNINGHKAVFHTGGFRAFRCMFIQVHEMEYAFMVFSNGTYSKLLFELSEIVSDYYFP